jgi:hypothetical protein
MPAVKKKTAARSASKSKSRVVSDPTKMSATQKTIYNKLRKKGFSEKQAAAFSHHSAKRKDAAAAKKGKK